MDSVIIKHLVVGAFQVNCYLVACPETRKTVIIDPGGGASDIIQMIRDENLEPVYILNTHAHGDHGLANLKLKNSFDIPVCIHGADVEFFARPEVREQSEKELGLSPLGPADIILKEGVPLTVGNISIEIIHTPGHTPGSVCFLVAGNLFTGDTLFVGDVGRTDLIGGSFETLLESIKNKIVVLPAETQIRPGHDYGEMSTSTLAWELEENPYLTEFIRAE
jgi:glyoxylase-like metal-dependent hydrolase (beta-lactamase superfamily II)